MLSKILELLFPSTISEERVRSITYLTPTPLTSTSARGVTILSCTQYTDTHAHAAITLLKKNGNPQAAQLLATLLTDTLLEELSEKDIWNARQSVLLPMPMSAKRKRERGFNHIAKVCAYLPDGLKERVVTDVLVQARHVPMQKTLTREQRFANVKGMFSVQNQEKIAGAHIIVIDDVTTTGATLDEAVMTLRKAGAEVTAVALARA